MQGLRRLYRDMQGIFALTFRSKNCFAVEGSAAACRLWVSVWISLKGLALISTKDGALACGWAIKQTRLG